MAVEKLKPGKVDVAGNKLVIKVTDPELENPDILKVY